MIEHVGFCRFCDAFREADRNENFSYEGKRALFDYLEQLEEEIEEPIELDVIAWCCEYREEPLADVLKNYDLEDLEELEDATMVVGFDSGTGLVVYLQF